MTRLIRTSRKTPIRRTSDTMTRRVALVAQARRAAAKAVPASPSSTASEDRADAMAHVLAVADRSTLRRLAAQLGEY